jgi:DNA-binding NtrC family response regulator
VGGQAQALPFLAKPFSPAQLLSVLDEQLRERELRE